MFSGLSSNGSSFHSFGKLLQREFLTLQGLYQNLHVSLWYGGRGEVLLSLPPATSLLHHSSLLGFGTLPQGAPFSCSHLASAYY